MDYSILIGGQAGQGLQTISGVLARLFTRQGLHAFTHQDYMSRIRGGHNFNQVRFSDRPVSASRRRIDIIIALDRATADLHQGDLGEAGIVIYDGETIGHQYGEAGFLEVPLRRLAKEATGVRVVENTVAIGAVLGVLGMETGPLEELLAETFRRKGDEVVAQNIAAARAGHAYAREHCPRCEFTVGAAGETGDRPGLMLLDGATAVGLGALMSGCRFYAAYPMTPSTGILNFLAARGQDYGVVTEQAEDEIAAINMALGASFAGVRAMTGTAGGGFALMVEGLSLAGMTETPVVIFVGQRPAPATGLPTRTEQSDLLYVLHTAHGEFPRLVFAPGSPEQAFYLTNKAFDLAEKYQVPAIILGDQYLVDSEWSLAGLDTERLMYRNYRLRAAELAGMKDYRRHAFTGDGVSPLAEPGASEHLVVTDSDEHDEEGHIIEDAATRVKMVEKRLLKKLPRIREEMAPPEIYGDPEAETLLVGWGSNYGIMREAVDELAKDQSISMMHFSEIHPLPEASGFLPRLQGARQAICIENNATAQFARYLRAETGFEFTRHILRYDGRPFMLEELIERVTGND